MLEGRGFVAAHVFDLDIAADEDIDIWRLAAERGNVIVSKDADFANFVMMSETKQAVVWSRMGNTRKDVLLDRVNEALHDILSALDAGERLVEVR
jgi:predicted nuclease of predicted toxin-antitoxin system